MVSNLIRKKKQTKSIFQKKFSNRKERMRYLVIVVAFIIIVAAITLRESPDKEIGESDIDTEVNARESIFAEFMFDATDLQMTKEAQEAAVRKVLPVYRIDHEVIQTQLNTLNDRIDMVMYSGKEISLVIQSALLGSTSGENESDLVWAAVVEYTESFLEKEGSDRLIGFNGGAEELAAWLMPSKDWIPTRVFEEQPETEQENSEPRKVTGFVNDIQPYSFRYIDLLSELCEKSLSYVLNYGVAEENIVEDESSETKIRILRERPGHDLKSREEIQLSFVPIREEGRELLIIKIADGLQINVEEIDVAPFDRNLLQTAVYAMAENDVVETLYFDSIATDSARDTARINTEPVTRGINISQKLIGRGEFWSEQSRSDVKTYWEIKRSGQQPVRNLISIIIAHIILVGLGFWLLLRSVPRINYERTGELQALMLSLLTLCCTVIIGRIAYYFEPNTGLIVPITAGGLLIAILVNGQLASITSLLGAVFVSIQYGYSWSLLLVGGSMSLVGVMSIYAVRRRSDITSAVVKATFAGILTAVAISLATDLLFTGASLRSIGLIALNGLACVFIIPGLLSPVERLFKITTDIQLLEYSDLNNELLSRIAIEIPATYAHSLMLGQIAEAAADAIGANGLLARVCAYYHDIGKLNRPEYFSENQEDTNVHDEMSPRLSSRAIASHVTDGIKLAREHHLPKPIIDGISEHHGTGLISFFYQQALEQQKHGDVVKDDFRYPGPKPQSREMAILMICDAAESGVRSLKNPNEERIREFIDKIIINRSEDRQFDESGLTLKDLDTIKDAVTKRVMTSLHTRISYPEKVTEKEE